MPAADIDVGSVHVNAPLTNLAIKYKFIPVVAERVFPVVPVNKESDVYYVFAKEELLDYDTIRAPGTEANEMAWDVTDESYKCEEYALKRLVPKRVSDNADPPIRPAMTSIEKLKRALLTDMERRVQAIAQSTTLITNNTVPTVKWDAAAGATIEADVDGAKNNIRLNAGVLPNAILMNYEVSNVVKRWIKNTAYTTYSEWLDKDELPPVLWDLETIIAGAVRNTANAAEDEDLANIWNDNVTIFYKEPSPSIDALCMGYILRSQNWMTIDWYDTPRKGSFYEVSVIQDEVLAAESAGYILEDVLT